MSMGSPSKSTSHPAKAGASSAAAPSAAIEKKPVAAKSTPPAPAPIVRAPAEESSGRERPERSRRGPYKICFLSSEVAPFAKTGGLADVSAALPQYLHRAGHDVRIFLPFYSSIDRGPHEFTAVDFLQAFPVELGTQRWILSVYSTKLPGSDTPVYLLHCPELYDRPGIYDDSGDEHLRFALLARATVECCQRMGWGPDVFHCNDWHVALLPLYLKTRYQWDRLFHGSRTVLTLHNLAYQGVFSSEHLGDLDLADQTDHLYLEDLGKGHVSFLKTGILYADWLTTVSPTYAQEIQTEDYGMGLESLLQARQDHLRGILNGVDYDDWNPETDRLLPHHYSKDDLSGKTKNKAHLLRELGLPTPDGVPLLGIVSRLTAQKGLELLFEPLPAILTKERVQLAVLGSGEKRFEEFFGWLEHKFPDQVCFYRGYNNHLSHLIEAGSDMFLMPSQFEPCGLNQMYSLRYGTVPIVRKTGGLADSVELFDRETGEGTGFVFDHYSAAGVDWAIRTALETYADQEAWSKLIQNGMSKNYSWEIQTRLYEDLYAEMVEAGATA